MSLNAYFKDQLCRYLNGQVKEDEIGWVFSIYEIYEESTQNYVKKNQGNKPPGKPRRR
jgi:hypothetical protein